MTWQFGDVYRDQAGTWRSSYDHQAVSRQVVGVALHAEKLASHLDGLCRAIEQTEGGTRAYEDVRIAARATKSLLDGYRRKVTIHGAIMSVGDRTAAVNHLTEGQLDVRFSAADGNGLNWEVEFHRRRVGYGVSGDMAIDENCFGLCIEAWPTDRGSPRVRHAVAYDVSVRHASGRTRMEQAVDGLLDWLEKETRP